MGKIKSLSDSRMIIRATMGGQSVNMLVDTGATVGLLSDRLPLHAVGATVRITDLTGSERELNVVRDYVVVDGRAIAQFLRSDMRSIQKSIRKETGLTIDGILSLPQMRSVGINIDTSDMTIKI